MALTTEMITTAEVQSLALVDSNLDPAYLDQYILTSQRHYIRKFIGNDWYEELLTQIAASSLTADNTNAMVYIKRALAHFVVFESLPQIRTQIQKGGVYSNISETSEPATAADYGNTRNDYLVKAEREREELAWYIKDVREDTPTAYPLYSGTSEQNSGIIIY
jgi:hypothetical protein